ncbi:MAG: hypothetical protein AABY07_00845 [Nanoarchaeota archaeon]
MTHSQQCIKNQAKTEKEREEYLKRYPNYCRKCNGEGGESFSYDPSPAGVSLSPGFMIEFEPCDTCTEKGICARCGYIYPEVLDDDNYYQIDDEKCPVCQFEAGKTYPIPSHECFCYEDSEYWC